MRLELEALRFAKQTYSERLNDASEEFGLAFEAWTKAQLKYAKAVADLNREWKEGRLLKGHTP